MKAVIDTLADQGGVPKADILRQAIALLRVVKDAEARGESPALIDRQGNVVARLIGIS